MRITLIIFAIIVLSSCEQKSCDEATWNIVYKHDANGKTIQGDKFKLIDAARLGYLIRIGFGGRNRTDSLKSIEHIADAEFLSIVNGKELFAQINPIDGQRPDLNSDTLRIDLKHENKWTLVIGTNGERSTLSRYFDAEKVEESKAGNRGATWYCKLPKNGIKQSALPLWD